MPCALLNRDELELIKSPKRNATKANPIIPITSPERFLSLSSDIITSVFFVNQVSEYTKVLEK